jgi:hypothetical protein
MMSGTNHRVEVLKKKLEIQINACQNSANIFTSMNLALKIIFFKERLNKKSPFSKLEIARVSLAIRKCV